MCKKLGKEARLTLVGEDTEGDKTIVDSISDPIMHIVRNSMDHGIEDTEDERVAAGKDPVGEIILSARHTGSEVIIEIKDDGRGVDDEAVLRKAINNGIASPDVEYSHREILNFLLAPGFSTNTEVTEYSGRGVGMDVVKRNVEDVAAPCSSPPSRQGHDHHTENPAHHGHHGRHGGLCGRLHLYHPDSQYPQSFRIEKDALIRDASGGEMFKCMGEFYPVVRMRDLYQMDEGFTDIQDGILMWLESGEQSYCLFVDQLLGEQQVVVKPLPSYLNSFSIKPAVLRDAPFWATETSASFWTSQTLPFLKSPRARGESREE